MGEHSSTELSRSGATQERITIAFLVLAWFFILLRIWTRTRIMSNFGWDDSTMILAGFMFTSFCSAEIFISSNGGGTHITDIGHLRSLTKWVVVSEATYLLSMMILKISLGIFFARIVVKKSHFALIYVAVGINIISSLAAFFYCIFRCGANLDNYAIQQLTMKCTPQKLDLFMAYQSATFNTLTDFVFLLLPMTILWNANMGRKSKVSVGLILCIAALGCICSIIRFRYVSGLTEVNDFFWNAVNISTWSAIEAGASITAGCLATLRPLLKRIIGTLRDHNILSSYITQVSRSLRSTPNASSNISSAQPPNSMTLNITRPSRHSESRRRTIDTDDPDFMDFLALPGHEVAAGAGRERKSTELILGKAGERHLASSSPPSVSDVESQKETGKRRRTVHESWIALRNSAVRREDLVERPISQPLPPPRVYGAKE